MAISVNSEAWLESIERTLAGRQAAGGAAGDARAPRVVVHEVATAPHLVLRRDDGQVQAHGEVADAQVEDEVFLSRAFVGYEEPRDQDHGVADEREEEDDQDYITYHRVPQ